MNYLAIVGALSPLGQKVIAELQTKTDEYRIVFTVDPGYECVDVAKAQFQRLEQVLTHNLNPTLVLDFGDYQQAFERAKFYRQNGFPAIMQAVMGKKNEEMLECLYRSTNLMPSPLVIVPDFSVVKTQLLQSLKAQVALLRCNVNRIYVGLLHNADEEQNMAFWLSWAQSVNEILGEYTEKYCVKGNTMTLGFVRVTSKKVADQDANAENMGLSVLLADNSFLKWEWSGNLLESRVAGVMKVLDWYFKNIRHNVDLASGELVIDILSELI